MNSVIVTAEDHDHLNAIVLARDLYVPQNVRLNSSQYIELCLRFKKAYNKLHDHPDVKKLIDNTIAYIKETKQLAIPDSNFKYLSEGFDYYNVFYYTILAFIKFNLVLIFVFPGLITFIPFALIVRNRAENERIIVNK